MTKLDSILKILRKDIMKINRDKIIHYDIPQIRKQDLNDIQRFQVDMIDADVIDHNYNHAVFDFYELNKVSHQ